MILLQPSFEILDHINGNDILKRIELAGRVCYKSEDKITDDSAKSFVASIIKREHDSVLEHEKISVRVICDRGVSHEIVRHRIASYSLSTLWVWLTKTQRSKICSWFYNKCKLI